ncbi:MAG: shikimate dehydrogenase [Clostridia bacterium]|nr:shikimate dehydrogenase [Clostridia bacterium]
MIDAKTRLLAIIGDPVEHSKSPAMHGQFAELCGDNMVYTAFHVTRDRLADAITGMRALGIRGLNVTAPHKFDVLQYLDEISEEARLFSSVNTVVNENGRLIGYNTDADGFYRSLLRAGITIEGKDVLIFGAGGATQPVCMRFAMNGAKSITVINRTKERAERLRDYVKSAIGYEIETEMKLSHYDVVINTTAAGMHPQIGVLPYEDLSFIDEKTAAVDMIYNPWETAFLELARKQGAKTLNGLGMLIYQGILAYELFAGHPLPENAYELTEELLCK